MGGVEFVPTHLRLFQTHSWFLISLLHDSDVLTDQQKIPIHEVRFIVCRKLFTHKMTYDVWHTFISPFKLCNVCLFRRFPVTQLWRLFKQENLKTIWKSQHHYLVSATALQKNCFFFRKKQYLCLITSILFPTLYSAPLLLCHKYLFLYDFQFIHPFRHPSVFYKKGSFNFWKHPSIGVLIKNLLLNFLGNFPVKHPWWSHLTVH